MRRASEEVGPTAEGGARSARTQREARREGGRRALDREALLAVGRDPPPPARVVRPPLVELRGGGKGRGRGWQPRGAASGAGGTGHDGSFRRARSRASEALGGGRRTTERGARHLRRAVGDVRQIHRRPVHQRRRRGLRQKGERGRRGRVRRLARPQNALEVACYSAVGVGRGRCARPERGDVGVGDEAVPEAAAGEVRLGPGEARAELVGQGLGRRGARWGERGEGGVGRGLTGGKAPVVDACGDGRGAPRGRRAPGLKAGPQAAGPTGTGSVPAGHEHEAPPEEEGHATHSP